MNVFHCFCIRSCLEWNGKEIKRELNTTRHVKEAMTTKFQERVTKKLKTSFLHSFYFRTCSFIYNSTSCAHSTHFLCLCIPVYLFNTRDTDERKSKKLDHVSILRPHKRDNSICQRNNDKRSLTRFLEKEK